MTSRRLVWAWLALVAGQILFFSGVVSLAISGTEADLLQRNGHIGLGEIVCLIAGVLGWVIAGRLFLTNFRAR